VLSSVEITRSLNFLEASTKLLAPLAPQLLVTAASYMHEDLREVPFGTSIIITLYECFDEICTLLGYYAEYGDDFLPTFRDICLETSVRNHHHTLHNMPEERRSRSFRGQSLKLCSCFCLLPVGP